MSSTAQRMASGSLTLLAGQVIVFLSQFAYVAATSRSMEANSFGVYAVSAVLVAVAGLITSGGVGQAVMRAPELPLGVARSMSLVSVVLGLVGALLVIALAPFWVHLWGVPEALHTVMASSGLVGLSPLVAFYSGLARREHRYRSIAMTSVISTLVGFIAGGLVVWLVRSPEALVVAPTLTAFVQVVGLVGLQRPFVAPGPFSRSSMSHLAFTGSVTVGNILSFVAGNIGKYGISAYLGVSALGYWNRAESVTTAPFQLVQRALVQAIYPEMRTVDGSQSTHRQKTTDVVLATAWIMMPLAALAAGAMPFVIPLLLGDGWGEAVPLVVILSIVAGVVSVASVFGSVLELRGRFRLIYSTQTVQIAAVVASIFVAVHLASATAVAVGLLAAQVIRHALQVAYSGQILARRPLLLGYLQVGFATAAAYLIATGLGGLVFATDGVCGPVLGATLILVMGVLLRVFWRVIPPAKLIGRYGVFTRGV